MSASSYAGERPAPDFPPLEWLNVEKPLSLRQLRGKVVLLDFWTYGCINCLHVIPDLKRLEAEYPEELAVVGVHSAKFAHEGDVESIRQIIRRYELEHPVVNDKDYMVWRAYHVRAWPTVVVIDPAGNYVGSRSGEDVYEALEPVVRSLVREFDARGALDRRPLPAKLEEATDSSVFRFPGKVSVDLPGRRLFVADTNNDRVVVLDLDSYEVKQVYGGPAPGFADGNARQARFFRPQGMALSTDGRTLYVADTENHALRRIDLVEGTVDTLAGTGRQARAYPGRGGRLEQVELNSPWDLQLVGDRLYVAMAGSHQLWRLDLDRDEIHPWVGSGAEGIDDGQPFQATLAQPSGLTADGTWLYFADPEASAVRAASLTTGSVRTLVGTGLFEFGDVDGPPSAARLQHALGVAYRPEDGLLYVADTYNSKLKTIDPTTGETRTLAGGERGLVDGEQPRFNEPGGLAAAGPLLYVADTNNHAIRVIDLKSLTTQTLQVRDPLALLSPAPDEAARVVELPEARLRAGAGSIRLDVALPEGFELSTTTPVIMDFSRSSLVRAAGGLKRRRLVHPQLPLDIPALFRQGTETAVVEVDYSFCPVQDGGGLCRPGSARFRLPLEVGADGQAVLELAAPPAE